MEVNEHIRHKAIAVFVFKFLGLEYEDAVSRVRDIEHVTARCIACKILREKGFTFSMIGDAVRREHSTAMHLVNRELIKSEEQLMKTIKSKLKESRYDLYKE